MSELKLIIQNGKINGTLKFDKKKLHDLTKFDLEMLLDTCSDDGNVLPASISIKNVDQEDDLYCGLEYIFMLDEKDLHDLKTFIETALKTI